MAIEISWMEGVGQVEYTSACLVLFAATSFVTALGAISFVRFRTITLFWLFSAFFFSDMLLIVEFAANLLSNPMLLRLAYSVVLSAWMVSAVQFLVHLASKSNPGWPVIPLVVVVVTINWIMFDPATEIGIAPGAFIINNELAVVPFFLIPLVIVSMSVYSLYIMYKGSPDFVRRGTRLLFLASVLNLLASIFSFLFPYALLMAFDAASMVVFAIVIYKHPGLFTIVTYRAQYLVVFDENDEVVLDFWWQRGPALGIQKAVGNVPGTGEIKAMMRETISKLGAVTRDRINSNLLVEFEVDHGVYLVCKDPRKYTIGLFTRFTSQAIRDGIKVLMARIGDVLEKSPDGSAFLAGMLEGIMKTQMLTMRSLV